MIILDKLTGSENYQSWANSVDLWFINYDGNKFNKGGGRDRGNLLLKLK